MDSNDHQNSSTPLSFSAFESVTAEAWMAKIELDLKEKNWKDYFWEIEPGIEINPAQFHPEKEYRPLFFQNEVFWLGQQLEVANDYVQSNEALLKLLMLGVSSPQLLFSQPLTAANWEELLNQVEIDYLNFHLHFADESTAKSSLAAIPKQYTELKGILTLGTGNTASTWKMTKEIPQLKALSISSEEIGIVDQLTDCLIQVDQCMRQEEKHPAEIIKHLHLSLSLGNEMLAEIAKLRAMRLLMELYGSAYGLSTSPITYSAVAQPLALGGEPELDVIRMTSIALAANLGGADGMNFPVLSIEKKDFFQRITSNIQHIFELESHLGKVGDPLAGSHFMEALTDQLAKAAWQKFQQQA